MDVWQSLLGLTPKPNGTSEVFAQVQYDFSEGQMRLAAPTISFQPGPYVDLVKVRF